MKATLYDKITWLLKHQNLWEGYGADTKWKIRKYLYKSMVEDKMLSSKTGIVDVNFDRMISLARKKRRGDLNFGKYKY